MAPACQSNPDHTHKTLGNGHTMHNEGPKGPYGKSSATCVQWCGGLVEPLRLPPTCIPRFGESNLIARTAATRPQTLLGLDLWVASQVLFISFNPVSSATQCRAQTRTCQYLPSLQLKKCRDCVSRWVLLYLHPDLLIFWPRIARLYNS